MLTRRSDMRRMLLRPVPRTGVGSAGPPATTEPLDQIGGGALPVVRSDPLARVCHGRAKVFVGQEPVDRRAKLVVFERVGVHSDPEPELAHALGVVVLIPEQ